MVEPFKGFDEGDPGHVGYHLVHELLTDLLVLWGRPLVSHSTTPHTNLSNELRSGELGGLDSGDQWQEMGSVSASQFCVTWALWEGAESCWNATTCTQGFNMSSSTLMHTLASL